MGTTSLRRVGGFPRLARIALSVLTVRVNDGDEHSVGANNGSVAPRHLQVDGNRAARRDCPYWDFLYQSDRLKRKDPRPGHPC